MISPIRNPLLVVMLFVFVCAFSSHGNEADNPWIELFNGKDINNWMVKINHHEVGDNFANTFRVEKGMIKIRYDGYKDFNDQFGHLYYKIPYSYYHLKVDYRITGTFHKSAPDYAFRNSGVMLHSQDPRTMLKDQDWPISVELQFLAAEDDGKPRPTGCMCSPGTDVVFEGKIDPRHCITSTAKTYKLDEWVHAEAIVLGDSMITHIINGDTVLRYTKPQIGGGVVHNFDPAIKKDGQLLSSGFIALQSEGQPVDFKRVALKELPKP